MSRSRFSDDGRLITNFAIWAAMGLAFFGSLGFGANVWAAVALAIAALIVAIVLVLLAVRRWPEVFYGKG